MTALSQQILQELWSVLCKCSYPNGCWQPNVRAGKLPLLPNDTFSITERDTEVKALVFRGNRLS